MSEQHGPPWPAVRPSWWPEDERWPPRARRRPELRHFIRFLVGCVVMFVLLNVAITAIAVGVARLLGIVDVAPGAALFAAALIIVLVVVGSVIATGATYWRAAGPLRDALGAVERVAGGDYAARMEPRGPRELRRLVTSFNSMVERLEEMSSSTAQVPAARCRYAPALLAESGSVVGTSGTRLAGSSSCSRM